MIKAWTDAAEAGLLDRDGERGSTFAYLPGTPDGRAVSVTMPVRLPTWSVPFGLPPIFEMNLPEGMLRERLSEETRRMIFEEINEDLSALEAREIQAHLQRH